MVDIGKVFGGADPERLRFDPARMAMIGTAFRREIEAERLPGAVIAVARAGKLAYFEAFGVRDPATEAAMENDAVFSIASMTKPMTSVAIMQLFEQGRLLLGDPISAHLPEFAGMTRGVVDQDGQLRRVEVEQPPTIQDLLRHTSGLTYQNRGTTKIHTAYPGSSATAALSLTKPQAIAALASCPLLFEPGTAWEYGFSTDVLGFIIEAITGQTLGQYLGEHIWGPLGLSDTAFDLDDASRARYARAFDADPLTGEPQSLYHERDGIKHWEAGGAGAVSTALDYLTFAEALRQGGELGWGAAARPQDGAPDDVGPSRRRRQQPDRRYDGPGCSRLRFRARFRGEARRRRRGACRQRRRLLLVRRVRDVFLG